MFTRCLSCYAEFEPNQTIERFAVCDRIAYDPGRGRLWAMCASCSRWTLAPIHERWEALEELERTTTDRGHMLIETENIALIEAGDTRIVRVGPAGLREEAWWRYGEDFAERRKKGRKIVRRGRLLEAALAMAIAGFPVWGIIDEGRWIARARRRHFGRIAWRGASTCPTCGRVLDRLRFDERAGLTVVEEAGETALLRPCAACAREGRSEGSGYAFHGPQATHILQRVLAYHHFAGANENELGSAIEQIDRAGSATGLRHSIAVQAHRLEALPPERLLALEIAVNEDRERALLELEAAQIEARWREEEELAAIIDRELT